MKIKNHREAGTWFKSLDQESGFTLLQVVITTAVVVTLSAFAMLGITSARASMRLTGSTRELAGYLEKARGDAIRRNASSTVTIVNANSYSVNMDFDGDGVSETRTFTLQDGVTFVPGAIGVITTFDWRGRVPNQVGITLTNGSASNSINISGSGDLTLGSEIFQDSAVAAVDLNSNVSANVASAPPSASPSSSPTPEPTPTPTPNPTPTPTPNPTPTPTPNPTPTPTPAPTPTPTPNPTPTPTPNPTPTPTPNPTPVASPTPACSISAPGSVTFPKNGGSGTFSVTVSNASSVTLTATKTGDISSVTPGTTTVSGNGTIVYTVAYSNGSNKSGTVTITSSCGTKTVTITME